MDDTPLTAVCGYAGTAHVLLCQHTRSLWGKEEHERPLQPFSSPFFLAYLGSCAYH